MHKNRNLLGHGLWLLLTVIVVQLTLLAFAMPLSAIQSDGWFFHIDNPYHIYQLELGRDLQSQANWNGYDPYFGAGTPAGLSSNVSARLTLLVAALLPSSFSSNNIYAIYVLGCSLSAPVSLWIVGRLLSWSSVQQYIAIIVGILMWWIGVFHWYHTAGMVSFVASCYLALPYGAWAYRLCEPRNPLQISHLFAAGLTGGLGMWLHPLFCVPSTLLVLGFVIQNRAYRDPIPLLSRATTIGVTVIVICLPWIMSLLNHNPAVSDMHGYQRAVGLTVLIDSVGINTGAASGSWLNLVVLIGSIVGLWFRRGKVGGKVAPLLPVGFALLTFSAFGGLSETLAIAQPNRFIGPAYLLIGLAASRDLAAPLSRLILEATSFPKWSAITMVLTLALISGREIIREVTPGTHGHHGKSPPEISAPPEVVSIIEFWINSYTNLNGRILFETSLGRVHGGGHVAGYLAARTKREFMGGAYPYFLPKSSCWDGYCFGLPIESVSPELFQQILAAYNTHWIIAHSKALKQLVESTSTIRKVAEFNGITFYTLDAKTDFIMHGNGRIANRTIGGIEIQALTGADITLRYHWAPGLRTSPPSHVEPHEWSDDYPPFVRVVSPPSNFVLHLN